MDDEILDAVTGWGTRPVSDGVVGLYELADAEFSGAVTDGTAWAFFLNGRVVGVFDGAIDDFEDVSLTAYTAPDISLPLLYAMQAGDTETRAQYYTNETPLSTTDETLSAGNFVGYVELSENVLSGDYYVVYYGGRSLPVAYVGNEPTLLTGDEAFDRADDEVGIYSVVDAEVTVTDLPERPDDAPDPAAGAAVDAGDDDTGADGPSASPPADAGSVEATDGDDAPAATDESDDAPATAAADGPPTKEATASDAPPDDEDGPDGATAERDEDGSAAGTTAETDGASTTATMADADGVPGDADAMSAATGTERDDGGAGTDVEADTADAGDADGDAEEVERLRRELDEARAAVEDAKRERDEAREKRDAVADERDELRAEREELQEEVERLQGRVGELESRLAEADPEAAEEVASERRLDPATALSETNLFVRYADRADGTLEQAAKGTISPEQLESNLQLDYHTEFDADDVRVEGRSFEPFLRSTTEHRFVRWLLTHLLYEIRRTDSRHGVSKLFEAIERIDRIDFDGTVDVPADGEGAGEGETTVSFDVVFRDKMGEPLFVAAFDDSRNPTGEATIESLLERSLSVIESSDAFAAAFAVTASFFNAGAMEAAVDATRGGLFSRSRRQSYVKLSRKRGFHLCLVEARDDDFFLREPEL